VIKALTLPRHVAGERRVREVLQDHPGRVVTHVQSFRDLALETLCQGLRLREILREGFARYLTASSVTFGMRVLVVTRTSVFTW
jgi:hypothetical protein